MFGNLVRRITISNLKLLCSLHKRCILWNWLGFRLKNNWTYSGVIHKRTSNRTVSMLVKYTRDNNYYSCILVLNITKAGFQHKPRIFFLFCDLVFIDFFNFLAVFAKNLAQKTWIPWVVFMILNKKTSSHYPLRPTPDTVNPQNDATENQKIR